MYDIIVIGAGPAGVSATLYARARGANVALVEKNAIGGLVGTVSKVSHYTGIIADETGKSFAARLKDQIDACGCTFINGEVDSVDLTSDVKTVTLKNGDRFEAKAVIIATGNAPKDLGLDKENELGVSHIARDFADDVKDKTVFVAGGSDGAVKEALFLAKHAAQVHIVQIQDAILTVREFRDELEKAENITIHLSSEIAAIDGADGSIKKVVLKTPDGEKTFAGDDSYYVFAYIGQAATTAFLGDALALENGYIPAHDTTTTIPGVFAAGDVRVKTVRQVSTAVADGTFAGIKAFTFINQ